MRPLFLLVSIILFVSIIISVVVTEAIEEHASRPVLVHGNDEEISSPQSQRHPKATPIQKASGNIVRITEKDSRDENDVRREGD